MRILRQVDIPSEIIPKHIEPMSTTKNILKFRSKADFLSKNPNQNLFGRIPDFFMNFLVNSRFTCGIENLTTFAYRRRNKYETGRFIS